jgi:4-methyl-5(b-hydroxyethyl)-thiazole monophosphate biosynthesis
MKVIIPLVEGFEEIEAATIIDVLRRAGIETHTLGLNTTMVEGSHGIKFSADFRLSDIAFEEYDVLVLPGGDPGYKNLANSNSIMSMIKFFNEKNKLIGAICAAPVVLAKAGVLDSKKATVFPTMEKNIPNPRKGIVIVDKNIVTSPSPGAAIPFALKLVELISGKEKSDSLRTKLLAGTEGN